MKNRENCTETVHQSAELHSPPPLSVSLFFIIKAQRTSLSKKTEILEGGKGGGEAKHAETESSGKGMINDCESKY